MIDIYIYLFSCYIYDISKRRKERKENERDVKMERWKDGKMERWKDGKMERWKDGKMETRNKKTRKVWIIKARPRRVPNVERTFYSKQKLHSTKRHDIGIVRLQRWQTILRYVFAARRAPQITVLGEYFCRADIMSTPSGKSAHGAQKAAKNAAPAYPRVL